MRIIRKIYFSFLIEDKRDMSICKLAINGGYFQFGVSYLDGSSSSSSEVSINKIEEGSIPTGIMSFYQEIPWFGKMYVEIDFDEFKKLGNVVYNYAEPCCKINNIFDKNDHIWEVISSNSKTSPTQFTDFTKLNFGVDGDSITAGDQWSYYVTKILGFSNHHNVAVGSAKWSCRKQNLGDVTYQTQEYDDPEFAGISSGYEETSDPIEIQKRCNNCAKVHVQKFIDEVAKGQYPAPDIFAFAMGTNDGDMTPAESAINTGTEYPTGDMLFTLAGAMKWCIQKIHETYPNCKIFILLPIQRYNGGNSYNLQKIEIMKDIAKAFSVPIIDMYSNCGISSMLENGTGPYLRDGLHPNTEGQKLMGSYAATQIRNNYLVIE